MEIITLQECLRLHAEGAIYLPDWFPSMNLMKLLKQFQPQHLDKQLVVCSNYLYSDVTEAYDGTGNLVWGTVNQETGDIHSPVSLNLAMTEFTNECLTDSDPDMLLLKLFTDLNELKEKWADITISTDVCGLKNKLNERINLPKHNPEFLWVNSPITKICKTYDEYLSSLTKKRRYKTNQSLHFLKKNGYEPRLVYPSYSVVRQCMDIAKERWSEDQSSYESTVRSILFTASMTRENKGSFVACLDKEGTESIVGFTRIGGCISLQFILGKHSTNIITWFIKKLHEDQDKPEYFDPGCICGMIDMNEIYTTYKRLYVNQECVKPLVYMTASSLVPSCIKPPFFSLVSGWVIEQEPKILFEPL